MIFYFSATGNSKRVAERIAQETGDDRLVDIGAVMRTAVTQRFRARFRYGLAQGEAVGVAFPVYFWGLPSVVDEFFDLLTLDALDPASVYAYCVATYGTTTGQVGNLIGAHLARQGIVLAARFGVQCPDTFTPMFNLSNPDKVAVKVARAEQQIDEVATHVAFRDAGNFMRRTVPAPLTWAYRPFYQHYRLCGHLSATDGCIGCGRCAQKCPCAAIEMRGALGGDKADRRPAWIKERCAMCLRCLHCCPAHAIQYGTGRTTAKHGQYTNPHTQV